MPGGGFDLEGCGRDTTHFHGAQSTKDLKRRKRNRDLTAAPAPREDPHLLVRPVDETGRTPGPETRIAPGPDVLKDAQASEVVPHPHVRAEQDVGTPVETVLHHAPREPLRR